jgi:hypothetical protein
VVAEAEVAEAVVAVEAVVAAVEAERALVLGAVVAGAVAAVPWRVDSRAYRRSMRR